MGEWVRPRWSENVKRCAAVLLCMNSATIGAPPFVYYHGNATVEATWRSAAGGSVPVEHFESYLAVPTPFSGPSDQVKALPELGLVFDSAVPGAYPGVYANGVQAHSGVNQLANFGGGLGNAADYNIRPEPGKAIFAMGLWQCDPQGDLTLDAYGPHGALVGSIVAHINDFTGNSFAGFTSTVPIHLVIVRGNEGDGWNHLDDLQAVTRAVCPCDLNGDGLVEDADFVIFVAAYNILDCADPGMPAGCPPDFNSDGYVDDSDFVVFVLAYNTLECPE